MGIGNKQKSNESTEEQMNLDQFALGAADDLSKYQAPAAEKKLFKDMHTLSNPKLDDGENDVFKKIQTDLEGLSGQKTIRMLLRLGMLAFYKDAITLNKEQARDVITKLGELSARELELIQTK